MTHPSKTTRYPVHEHFWSFQGEGTHAGCAAFFVRLHGCDQKCSFCDSAGTWHPNYKPKGVRLLDAKEVRDLVPERFRGFVVLTGGEPALYDLRELVDELHNECYRVHLETAGHKPLPYGLNWITLSPKLFAQPPLEENWDRADEIKLICQSPEQTGRDVETILKRTGRVLRRQDIWLHPEWSQRENPALLRFIVGMVKYNPRLRAGYQMHKLFAADRYDENARPDVVPLGGEPTRGAAS